MDPPAHLFLENQKIKWREFARNPPSLSNLAINTIRKQIMTASGNLTHEKVAMTALPNRLIKQVLSPLTYPFSDGVLLRDK